MESEFDLRNLQVQKKVRPNLGSQSQMISMQHEIGGVERGFWFGGVYVRRQRGFGLTCGSEKVLAKVPNPYRDGGKRLHRRQVWPQSSSDWPAVQVPPLLTPEKG